MGNSKVFVLDIGTRKIAGLLMEKQDGKYIVHHLVMHEQKPNAMQDGQIHDIPQVAEVIKQVTEEIAAATGQQLTQAAVAAAGRSLRTEIGQATTKLTPHQEISEIEQRNLQLLAVQDALSKLNQYQVQTAIDTYFCVGYTTVQYYLDGQPIQNLVGHQGYSASVEVIATFLPRIVVDSLATALRLAGLELVSLTLEPIAALHTVIPPSMRMLNLALVDIGAGTSDIAITATGTIKAYGMITQAGDLFSQVIAEHYLLDFMEAERIKRLISSEDILICTDVLGNQLSISKDEILMVLKPAVTTLASKIKDEILALNDGAPKGVILIGGGSLTPLLAAELADQMQLPHNLVRIRDCMSLPDIVGTGTYAGPQLITPISIGRSHLDNLSMELLKVDIDGQPVQFLRLPKTTVAEALMHAGYTFESMITSEKYTLQLVVNHQPCAIEIHAPARSKIFVNGAEADLYTPLSGDEQIEIRSSEVSQKAQLTLADLIQRLKITKHLIINGKQITIMPKITVNGQPQPLQYQLFTGDSVQFEPIVTVAQALELAGITADKHSITVSVNHQQVKLETPAKILVNGRVVTSSEPVHDGDRIEYQSSGRARFILTDIFRVYQPDMLKHAKHVKFFINGEEAGYADTLQDGDSIRIEVKN